MDIIKSSIRDYVTIIYNDRPLIDYWPLLRSEFENSGVVSNPDLFASPRIRTKYEITWSGPYALDRYVPLFYLNSQKKAKYEILFKRDISELYALKDIWERDEGKAALAQMLSRVLESVDDNFIYCADNKVVVLNWGLFPRNPQFPQKNDRLLFENTTIPETETIPEDLNLFPNSYPEPESESEINSAPDPELESEINSVLEPESEQNRRKFPAWLSLLLVIPMLFIRCEHRITVECIDEKTHNPVPNVEVALDYDSFFLLKNKKLICSNSNHREQISDDNGKVVFESLECSVFSYVFHLRSKVDVSADGNIASSLFHLCRVIKIYLKHYDCRIDLVMCVDCTASMEYVHNMVRDNVKSMSKDLCRCCDSLRRNVIEMRVKLICYDDLDCHPIRESQFFSLPQDSLAFVDAADSMLQLDYYGSNECGLHALALAMKSQWVASSDYQRHVIVLYTDEGFEPLERYFPYSPRNIPTDLSGLKSLWDGLNWEDKRMVLFTSCDFGWSQLDNFGQIQRRPLSEALNGNGYDAIIKAVCDDTNR